MYSSQYTTSAELLDMARRMRINIIKLAYLVGNKGAHIGSALSCTDILAVLYGSILNYNVADPMWSQRDRFLLGKGHGALALYAALYEIGLLSKATLFRYQENGFFLPGQPVMNLRHGIEASSGSLGHMLSLGEGIALFAKNTGEKIGRKEGHKKEKLEPVNEEKINEHIKHELTECPNCKKHELEPTGEIITKQVKDYKIIVNYTEHEFIEYKCNCCGKVVHETIPNHLKEDIQYGSNVKSIALTLSNVGNVSLNKIRRILNGLSMEEIDPCEGYLVKLQKNASKRLTNFIEELHKACITSKILYWDDTVISIDKKQSCMRYYGNDFICLFKAHEKKNKEGIDEDKILSLLGKNTIVEHDHNKINYNPEYEFINAECCQHLDLCQVFRHIVHTFVSINLF